MPAACLSPRASQRRLSKNQKVSLFGLEKNRVKSWPRERACRRRALARRWVLLPVSLSAAFLAMLLAKNLGQIAFRYVSELL